MPRTYLAHHELEDVIIIIIIVIIIIHFLVIIVIVIIDFIFFLLLLLLVFLLLLWLMQDPGLLPDALLRRMVAGTSLTGKVAVMTAAQMQLAWEDSMASSSAMTTALVVVVSASSVATSPHTADDEYRLTRYMLWRMLLLQCMQPLLHR